MEWMLGKGRDWRIKEWNFVFLRDESRRVTCISGRAMARTMPGKPAPEPISMREEGEWGSRWGRRVRASRMCLSRIASGVRMAVKLYSRFDWMRREIRCWRDVSWGGVRPV